jgi:hypothetical protein
VIAALQMHGGKQTHQSKIVVAMQMTNENMVDAAVPHFKLCQTNLSTFSTIYQIEIVVMIDHLGGVVPSISK